MNQQFYATAHPDRYDVLRDFARKNRKRMTLAEEYIWNEVRAKKLGVTFRRQYPIADFIADFVCLQKRLVIEIDGGYHETTEQQQADENRTTVLTRLGYRILRYTNQEVLNDLSSVINDIQSHLR